MGTGNTAIVLGECMTFELRDATFVPDAIDLRTLSALDSPGISHDKHVIVYGEMSRVFRARSHDFSSAIVASAKRPCRRCQIPSACEHTEFSRLFSFSISKQLLRAL